MTLDTSATPPLHWIELGSGPSAAAPPASGKALDALTAAGRAVDYRQLAGEPFWTIEEPVLIDALIEAGHEADLLIAEALFYDKPIKWHLDYASLAAHLDAIAAKRVILTHLGPDMLARLPDLDCETAADGMCVEV